jgi:hypothetical protein
LVINDGRFSFDGARLRVGSEAGWNVSLKDVDLKRQRLVEDLRDVVVFARQDPKAEFVGFSGFESDPGDRYARRVEELADLR